MSTAITNIRGTAFRNGYLWPTESWALCRTHPTYFGRWRFGIVALSNGLFAVNGQDYAIRENKDGSLVNNFPTRDGALRASAARLIREMRTSKAWPAMFDGLEGERLQVAITWVLETVAAEIGQPVKRLVSIPEPVELVPSGLEGLPLFAKTL